MPTTKLVSITVATFLMTLIWTLPTVYAGHCKGPHADFPECPLPPPDIHDELKADHADLGLASEHTSLDQKLDQILTATAAKELIPIAEDEFIAAGANFETSIPMGNITHITFLGTSSSSDVILNFKWLTIPGTFLGNTIPNLSGFECLIDSAIGVRNCRVNNSLLTNATFEVGGPHLAIFIHNPSTNTTLNLFVYPAQ